MFNQFMQKKKNNLIKSNCEIFIAGGLAALKKLKKDKEKIYLIPENDNYKIQSFNPDEVSIQGKLKGIIRSY